MTSLAAVPQPGCECWQFGAGNNCYCGRPPGAVPQPSNPLTQPYTDADVELVAAALCPKRADLARADARAVLDGLAAAGRLNTAIAHQFSVRYPGGVVDSKRFTEAGARQWADTAGGEVVYREVGPWIEAP